MMAPALVAALALLSAATQAQRLSTDTSSSTSAASPDTTATSPTSSTAAQNAAVDERIRREVDLKVDEAKKELREEMRAQSATKAAAEGWQEEWVEEKRKLELFVADGYFRIRPELFYKFDLGRPKDPAGYTLFPKQGFERTIVGVNTRFQFDPTLNVSEEVRIKAQIEALDNIAWGSTPDYAYALSDRVNMGVLSLGQVPPQAGINAALNSILVRRVWGEVATPVGILRFGRMGVQWGLGMYHNDGNCLDCDYGETQDRAQFVVEPLPGYYVIPSFDLNAAGVVGNVYENTGPTYNLAQADDTWSVNLVLARKDTDAQVKARLENNLSVFNYGLYFTYRQERYESLQQGQPYQNINAFSPDIAASNRVARNAYTWMPDLWMKFERKRFRFELEGMGIFGATAASFTPANAGPNGVESIPLTITQWGAAAESEVKFLDGALKVGLDFGVASGDRAYGMGNHPARTPLPGAPAGGPAVGTVLGDIDGAQYCIAGAGTCAFTDTSIRNFQFSRDYHIDLILWRELLGGITDAYYVRPNAKYTITDGLAVYAAGIYSGAIYASSTPSTASNQLGIELNAGVSYDTEDGFFADVRYGVLFPLAGLNVTPTDKDNFGGAFSLDIAQAIRGNFGIRF